MTARFVPVVPVADMPAERLLCTTAAGVPIVLCRVGESYHAVSNACTHAASTFDGGRMRGPRLICPLHGAMFDVRSGQPNGQLAREPLTVYPTRVNDEGIIEVCVVDASGP